MTADVTDAYLHANIDDDVNTEQQEAKDTLFDVPPN